MNIEQLLPHALEFIDIERLGERRVAMMLLVYELQAGKPCAVPLSPRRLAELTARSPIQAKYDTKALDWLCKADVLRKMPGVGRRANHYQLREPKLWKTTGSHRIVFRGRRDLTLGYLAAMEQGDWAQYRGDAAGQSLFAWRSHKASFRASRVGVSVDHRPTTELHRPTTESDRASNGMDHRPATPPGSEAPSQLPLASKEAIALNLEEEDQWLDQEAERLGRAVAKRIGRQRLWMRARQPIEATIRKYPDHLDKLYQVAETVPTDILDPVEAARTFEALADAHAAEGWPGPAPDPQIENLKRFIATLEHEVPDDDRLPQLRAELLSRQRSEGREPVASEG